MGVSLICCPIDRAVAAFLSPPLDHIWFPYLDAPSWTYATASGVVSRAVVTALGVSAASHREILGVAVGDADSGALGVGANA